ncbi:hypothetical protein RDI58_007438 [Solanum bulbocastanum]|uniref:Uncharacterized protein n=1 Tax=Solanum bulbocastanum TaxID=147425 RepID=A0AAN8TU01_SOLBU
MLKNDLLPDESNFPDSYYEAMKLIRSLGISYEKIDPCKNDCMLYWKNNKFVDSCKICGASRWKENKHSGETRFRKGKKTPHKILRYFPLKTRRQRLFMCSKTSYLMRWHHENKANTGIMRHPVDSKAWKKFDELHQSFAMEPRNENFVFSMLIPSPGSPGDAIDIYLQPLIDELNELWETGVVAFDESTKQNIMLHVALLWTINDFPAYANLSEWRLPPNTLSGDDILDQVADLDGLPLTNDPKKKIKVSHKNRGDIWNKKSIFFYLPYWKTLLLRHNLDVMHIEKNICDNIWEQS